MDSSRQKQHYNKIHDAYAAHYFDASSMKYRKRFMYDWLFDGIDLRNAKIADLACGSGYNSLSLMQRFSGVQTVGFDISESACASYRRTTGAIAHVIDLTLPSEIPEKFDAAIVIGGLHHCVANLPQTLRNIAGIVKPGGYFFMMEPSADYFLNVVRDKWYVADKYFDAATEQALSHDGILQAAAPFFEKEDVKYFGGVAYFLIYNSLIMRVPLGVKPILWPLLKPVEIAFGKLPWTGLFPCFLARWKRTAAPVADAVN